MKRLAWVAVYALALLLSWDWIHAENERSLPASEKIPETSISSLSSRERAYLLALARQALSQYLAGGERIRPKEPDLTVGLKENRACFVTLTKAGKLRGCIGYLAPMKPLCDCVIDNAIAAAVGDPRFPVPVDSEELKELTIEVSVLTAPRKLSLHNRDELPALLAPGKDGVIIRQGTRQATYLPQVWEHIPEPQAFLDSLCQKAGLPVGAWRAQDTEVLVYHAEAFRD